MRKTFGELGDDPEDDALHASRIAVKRARYAADLAAHELGKPGAKFVAVARSCRTSSATTRTLSSPRSGSGSGPSRRRPESAFAAGRLVQLERDRMAAARAAWPDTWKRLDEAAREAVS